MKDFKLILTALTITFFSLNLNSVLAHSVSISAKTEIQVNLNSDSRHEKITYSGVIVDCRGLGLKTSASPVIKNESGKIIYGDKDLDFDKINEIGMAEYTTTVQESVARVGKNPLIVRAIKLDKFNTCPILKNADAERVILANASDNFLKDLSVVFLTDEI